MHDTYTVTAMRIDALPLDTPMDMVDIPGVFRKIEGTMTCTITNGHGAEINSYGDIQSIKLTDVPITIACELTLGDKVAALIQHYGGQRFSLLGKI